MQNFTVALVIFLCTLGPSLVIGMAANAAIKAVGRNPAAAPKILVTLIFTFLFLEGIAVIGLVMVYNLFK